MSAIYPTKHAASRSRAAWSSIARSMNRAPDRRSRSVAPALHARGNAKPTSTKRQSLFARTARGRKVIATTFTLLSTHAVGRQPAPAGRSSRRRIDSRQRIGSVGQRTRADTACIGLTRVPPCACKATRRLATLPLIDPRRNRLAIPALPCVCARRVPPYSGWAGSLYRRCRSASFESTA